MYPARRPDTTHAHRDTPRTRNRALHASRIRKLTVCLGRVDSVVPTA